VLGFLFRASAFYLLLGAVSAAWAWACVGEPRRSRLLRIASWLVIPGYVGVAVLVSSLAAGVVLRGCDPVLGGWTRAPVRMGFPTSEILPCSETPRQARARPGEADRFPVLPTQWSQVYRHYDESYGGTPRLDWVWIFSTRTNEMMHVPANRLEFRDVPPRRGGLLWWQPLAASKRP
jgi:hypothetical protein